MSVTIVAPPGVDYNLHDDEEPIAPVRPCRCDHSIPIADEWFGSAWVRCVACGHDVEQVAP